jgi:hypothetical protein
MALKMSGVFLGLGIPITLSLELKRLCDIYPGHFHLEILTCLSCPYVLVEHKDETLIVILLVALFVLVSYVLVESFLDPASALYRRPSTRSLFF